MTPKQKIANIKLMIKQQKACLKYAEGHEVTVANAYIANLEKKLKVLEGGAK